MSVPAVIGRLPGLGGGTGPLEGRVRVGAAPGSGVAAVATVHLGAALPAAARPAGAGAVAAPPVADSRNRTSQGEVPFWEGDKNMAVPIWEGRMRRSVNGPVFMDSAGAKVTQHTTAALVVLCCCCATLSLFSSAAPLTRLR